MSEIDEDRRSQKLGSIVSGITGLIGGFGETVLNERRRKDDAKIKQLTAIFDSKNADGTPTFDQESRQKAMDELAGLTGLSPKGKGSEHFHRTRGMLETAISMIGGLGGDKKGEQGAEGGQAGAMPEVPSRSDAGIEGAPGGPAPGGGFEGAGRIPSEGQPGGGLPGGGPSGSGAPGGHPMEGAGGIPRINAPQGAAGQMPPVPSRSPYRLGAAPETAEQTRIREHNIKTAGEREKEFRGQEIRSQEQQQRRQLAQEFGVTGAAAAEFIEKGTIPAGLQGHIQEGKDAYQNEQGEWVRDLLNTATGERIGTVPATAAKGSSFDQTAQALLKSGKAKTEEEAYGMAVDQKFSESKAKISDIKSKIQNRQDRLAQQKQNDLTKVEKEELDILKSQLLAVDRQMATTMAGMNKETLKSKKATYAQQIEMLTGQIDDIQSQIEEKVSTIKSRNPRISAPGAKAASGAAEAPGAKKPRKAGDTVSIRRGNQVIQLKITKVNLDGTYEGTPVGR
jgi:hypothetical protein